MKALATSIVAGAALCSAMAVPASARPATFTDSRGSLVQSRSRNSSLHRRHCR